MSTYPFLRMRRLRDSNAIRRLVTETHFSNDDLIWPLFVHTEKNDIAIDSLPGVSRLSLEGVWRAGEKASQLKIPVVAVFPVIPEECKDDIGSEALKPDNIALLAVRGLKERFPDLAIMTDVALDPYTSHGQDGILNDKNYVANDETNIILGKQALLQAQTGVDIVAPSDMMDGRIGVIREILEKEKYSEVKILSYAAKYASSFYGPFRSAIGSAIALGGGDKRSYQINPANRLEAMREIELDLQEGADMVMVKPGMPYLDIIREAADSFSAPIIAYQVSGEYAMLQAAATSGWLPLNDCVMESLLAFKRAGASAIISYFAAHVAENILKSNS